MKKEINLYNLLEAYGLTDNERLEFAAGLVGIVALNRNDQVLNDVVGTIMKRKRMDEK